MSHVYGNQYSAQIGVPSGQTGGLTCGSNTRYEVIITDTFQSACGIARTLCKHGEQVLGVSLLSERAIVDIDAITVGD